MFQYQGAYKDNGRGLHMKTFWSSILVFILIYAAAIVCVLLMTVPFFVLDTGLAILPALAIFLLLILAAIFVFYPLAIGILNYFASTYHGRDFKFKDAFKVFSKGSYSKAIKMGLLIFFGSIAFSFAIGTLTQFIVMIVNAPALLIVDPTNMESVFSGRETTAIISLVLINFLVILISYIPYLLVTLYTYLVYITYIDEPSSPTADKFKVAWAVMFKGGQSVLRLIFSNLILWIIPIVIYALFVIAAVLLGIHSNEMTFTILMVAGIVVMMICYIIAMYFMVGSITAYYFKGRDQLDQAHQARQL